MRKVDPLCKANAYEDAIAFLISFESDSDGVGDREAREWLAKKLNKDCDRMLNAAAKAVIDTPGGKIASAIIDAL